MDGELILDAERTGANEVVDLKNPSLYINRELSQIEFNRRVLDEATKAYHPLLERVKFLAIYNANMDEFFMVRVSGLKQQVLSGVVETPADGMTPREQLAAINRRMIRLTDEMMAIWHEQLYPALVDAGIHVLNYEALSKRQKRKLSDYFEREIFPVLTPLAFDPSRPFPHISNLSLNLAALVRDPATGDSHFARVKVPASMPRLVPLTPLDPDELLLPEEHKFVWVEQVIAANLDRLFPGMEIVAAHPFRITRNNDMEIQEEEADDLLLTVEDNLRQRHFGFVVRLELETDTPAYLRDILTANLAVSAVDTYAIDGPLGLSALWELHRLELPELKDAPFQPAVPAVLRTGENIFSVLRRQDILIHHPYDSFVPVIDFVRAAATDPEVLAIKQTLYRVGPNPPIVEALIQARQNGKQVAALVELKARFDEESNIEWARALENAGVHVVYGLIGLKTHCKVCLVVRRERDGIRRYLHLATGNYNAVTARVYTDLGFMTSQEALGADASELFNSLTGYSKQTEYREFLVAPVNLRERLAALIEEEMAYGEEGKLLFKVNSLVDQKTIRLLYAASQKGVRIDLVVRGICSLRPGIRGISDNIRVMSVVGRFLEHSRIYYFRHGGDPLLYVGSADLMPRNIDRRVEVLFPVRDARMRRYLVDHVLNRHLQDSAQGRWLQPDGSYVAASELVDDDTPLFSSQMHLLNRNEEGVI